MASIGRRHRERNSKREKSGRNSCGRNIMPPSVSALFSCTFSGDGTPSRLVYSASFSCLNVFGA
eukprot:401373-Prymnesium_polylepis.1